MFISILKANYFEMRFLYYRETYIRKKTFLTQEEEKNVPHNLTDTSFQGTVVYRTLPSLH